MSKLSKRIILGSLFVLLVVCTTLLVSCSFSDLFRKTLKTPTININSSEQVITWAPVDNAEKYEVYINNTLKTTVNNSTSETQKNNVFNFSEYINETTNKYKLYIIALAEGYNNSPKSNEVTYFVPGDVNTVTSVKVNNTSRPVKNIEVDGKNIFWDEVKNKDEYFVSIYSNSTGTQIVSTDTTGLDLTDYIVENEILALRVGVKNNLDEVCFSDTVYYNDALYSDTYGNDAVTFENLFKTVYLFKGKYFDAYLTSQEEMNTMMYYLFVNRSEEQELAISQTYYNQLINKYDRSNYVYLVGNNQAKGGIGEATESFTETCDYTLNFNADTVVPARHFYVGYDFSYLESSGNQPTLTMEKELTQNNLDKGYYEKVNYTKRSNSFNNFVSDKQILTQYVNTSEQLYFAVENKITPLFNSETSTAYVMYNKAKNILREIISDEMTDYEKALSIFDWICINSVYDNKIVAYNSTLVSFINYKSFSIEGVLDDGLAVCDGYSKTFSLLCNMEGIDCVRLSGDIDRNLDGRSEGLHAWNKVKILGNWYVVDITWSVLTSGANDFGALAQQFNSNEFLHHMYFLISDDDILDHIASDTVLNEKCAAPNRYYYYYNQTYNGTNNLVITSNDQLNNVVAWMLQNKVYSIDIVFDKDVYGVWNWQGDFKTIEEAIKQAKTANGIEAANILSFGYKQDNFIYYSADKQGLIYCISLINLDKVDGLIAA